MSGELERAPGWPPGLVVLHDKAMSGPVFLLDGREITQDKALALVAHGNGRQQAAGPAFDVALAAGTLVSPLGVIFFANADQGVRLYASRDIPKAGFGIVGQDTGSGVGGPVRWRGQADMEKMIVITRPTLGGCLAELAAIWANNDRDQERQDRKAIGR